MPARPTYTGPTGARTWLPVLPRSAAPSSNVRSRALPPTLPTGSGKHGSFSLNAPSVTPRVKASLLGVLQTPQEGPARPSRSRAAPPGGYVPRTRVQETEGHVPLCVSVTPSPVPPTCDPDGQLGAHTGGEPPLLPPDTGRPCGSRRRAPNARTGCSGEAGKQQLNRGTGALGGPAR